MTTLYVPWLSTRHNARQPGMVRRMEDGYTVQSLDNGVDYWGIVRRFEEGAVTVEYSDARTDRRHVHIILFGGRRYVLKYRTMHNRHIECKISRFFLGEVFSRIMKRSNAAVAKGCDFIQRVYMVAEKREGDLSHSIALFEYIEGTPLAETDGIESYYPEIVQRIQEMHSYGLAFCDPNPGNFILTDNGLKVIDISFRNSLQVCKAKDVVMVKENYGIDMPVPGFFAKFMVAMVAGNRKLRQMSRRLRDRMRARAVTEPTAVRN